MHLVIHTVAVDRNGLRITLREFLPNISMQVITISLFFEHTRIIHYRNSVLANHTL